MNITSFRAQNVKKLKVVSINPDGSLVRITGANGSGKSSTLDALWYLLAGKGNIPSQPIRDGEDEATITATLGDVKTGVVKFKVTRKITRGRPTQVIVESAEGARFNSPQELLDRLFVSLTFDPEIFGRMSPKEQLNQLKALVPLSVDVDALDAQNRADYDSRTEVNRRVKQLKESVDLYYNGLALDMITTPIDVGDILAKMESAAVHNAAIEDAKSARGRISQKINDASASVSEYRQKADLLIKQAEKMEADALRLRAELDAMAADPDPVDVAELSHAVQEATRENTARQLQRDQRTKYKTASDAWQLAVQQSDALTAAIDKRTAEKRAAIAAAKMPVDGLGFGDNEVTFKGIPFGQISSGDQMIIQCEIAAALSPEVKIIRIRNGSLIDSKNMARLGEWATERGYQAWIEEVDETGQIGVYLEDGEVVAVDGVPVERVPKEVK